jgi:SAM-dependent methyltransferase
MTESAQPNDTSHDAWEANARVWDAKMGDEGNDFFRLLCWPIITEFLNVQPGQNVLDIACGNGLTSRKLAELGADVTAFDFSANLIELAKTRSRSSLITYYLLNATDEQMLLRTLLPSSPFDSALSNMALFDMPEIEPLFRAVRRLLKPDGCFVFSITHPSFNNPSSHHIVEEWDDGEIKTQYAIKISRYMTRFQSAGLGLRNQPKPQLYFHRPLEYYFNVGFADGFVLDGFAERAFPPDVPQTHPLGWGGNFSEIPPVIIARMRLK